MMVKNGAPFACYGRPIIFNNSDISPTKTLFTQNTVSVRLSCVNIVKLIDLDGFQLKCNNIITFEHGVFPTALYATIGNGKYTSAISINFNLMTPEPVSQWVALDVVLPVALLAGATAWLWVWVRQKRIQARPR
jgi:hypothetical protein